MSATSLTCNALYGSTVIYLDNYDPTAGGPQGVADLKMVDGRSSATGQPVTVRLAADPTYYLIPDRSRVIFTVTGASAAAEDGIYVGRF